MSVSILNSKCDIFLAAEIWKRLPNTNITKKPNTYALNELSVLNAWEIPAEKTKDKNGSQKIFPLLLLTSSLLLATVAE